jgi:hypothetical protein
MDEWQTLRRSIRNHIFVGGLGFLTLVGVFGGWAVGTEIVGAVIAQGSLVVETSLKKVIPWAALSANWPCGTETALRQAMWSCVSMRR